MKFFIVLSFLLISFNSHSKMTWKEGKRLAKLANAGDSEAAFKVGEAMYKGDFLFPNYVDAFEWIELAAKGGHKKAQFIMGIMTEAGFEVQQDNKKALYWYTKAGKAGKTEKIADEKIDFLVEGLLKSKRKEIKESFFRMLNSFKKEYPLKVIDSLTHIALKGYWFTYRQQAVESFEDMLPEHSKKINDSLQIIMAFSDSEITKRQAVKFIFDFMNHEPEHKVKILTTQSLGKGDKADKAFEKLLKLHSDNIELYKQSNNFYELFFNPLISIALNSKHPFVSSYSAEMLSEMTDLYEEIIERSVRSLIDKDIHIKLIKNPIFRFTAKISALKDDYYLYDNVNNLFKLLKSKDPDFTQKLEKIVSKQKFKELSNLYVLVHHKFIARSALTRTDIIKRAVRISKRR